MLNDTCKTENTDSFDFVETLTLTLEKLKYDYCLGVSGRMWLSNVSTNTPIMKHKKTLLTQL